MTYSLKPHITIRGITVWTVCSTVGTTVISGNSVFVSRQVTPVAIVIQSKENSSAVTLDGKSMSPRIRGLILSKFPEIRDIFK